MCIYCGTNKYRKIYENHYGPIPKEENGRSYEIHHIDGNHSNNDASNLTAITLQEHYDIHYSQEDYDACYLMAVQRMNKTPEEISELSSKAAKKRLENGTWHFTGPNHPGTKSQLNRIKNGTHHFQNSKVQSEINHTRVKNGTHPFLGEKNVQKQLDLGKHVSQIKMSCLYCRKILDKGNFTRSHGEKCKNYPKNLKL